MVHYRRGKAGGIDFEGQYALLAQGAEKYIAALHDFLGGDVAEHFPRCGGTFAKKFAQFRLGDYSEEHEMAVSETGDAFDHFRGRGGFGEIGEPDDQAAAFLKREESFRGALMIGFEFFAFHLCQALEERAHVARSAARRKALLDAAAVAEHGDAIAGIQRNSGQERQTRRLLPST